MTTHTYASTLHWTGRTDDYDAYGRRHAVTMGGTTIAVSADQAFRGDGALPNPEQMVVAAASSCQLLSFLALAAYAGIEVLEYHDEAEGFMPDDVRPVRLARIVLRPRVVVASTPVEGVARLLRKAHGQCYIANGLTADVTLDPVIEVR